MSRNNASKLTAFVLPAIALAIGLTPAPAQAQLNEEGVEGFTTPFRVLNLAAPEPGLIEELLVEEGDEVRQGDVLARLDNNVHRALLGIAKASMELEGKLKATTAEREMRAQRLKKLQRLFDAGHVHADELDRAKADYEIALGNVLTAEEQLLLKRLEHDKILAQIDRRVVRAPIDGTVTTIVKREGEFAAPNDPDVLILVQLDPLMAEFAVTRNETDELHVGKTVKVYFPSSKKTASGVVEFISPLTDAESGTIPVKVRIDNAKKKYFSGDYCLLRLNR